MTPALAEDVREKSTARRSVPRRIGRFLVREEIGRGSNGVVYAATDPILGREVAIKAIPLDARRPGEEARQAEIEAGFLQEAKIAAGLNHPSIVTVFDAGKTDSVAYIAMERLTGSDLHHWLASNHSMSAESAAALIARVADAVHFAHRRGLIHRDIKPSNIFLGRDMKPKVLDFGIALAQAKQGQSDEAGKLIGTPNYMSPEQAMGRPLDARSDVFSIGAILYEMITGKRAFDGANIDEILTKVVKADPPELSAARPEVSPVMEEIVFRALAKNPADRYQTAAQLRNDLAAFAGRPVLPSSASNGSAPAAASVPREPRVQSPRGGLIAVAIAVLGLSVTFGVWYFGRGNASEAAQASNSDAASEASSAAAKAASTPATPPAIAPTLSVPKPALVGANEPHVQVKVRKSKIAPTPVAPEPPPPPSPGTLSLAVVPWGQVLVDGQDVGVAPPLTHLSLAPGDHVIELRNGSSPVVISKVRIESDKTLLLQHRF